MHRRLFLSVVRVPNPARLVLEAVYTTVDDTRYSTIEMDRVFLFSVPDGDDIRTASLDSRRSLFAADFREHVDGDDAWPRARGLGVQNTRVEKGTPRATRHLVLVR